MADTQTSQPWLERMASWRILAVLVLLYGLVFTLLTRGMGGGHGESPPLDLMFSYSPAQVTAHLAQLGDAGRKAAIFTSAILDTAYPLVYSSLFAVLITLLNRFLLLKNKGWQYLAYMPFAILGFDLAENTAIIMMTINYPKTMPPLAHAASLFTSLKWSFAAFVIGTSMLLGLAALVKLIRRYWP